MTGIWFVSYVYHYVPLPRSDGAMVMPGSEIIANVVLRGIHPVVWLASPSKDTSRQLSHLSFYQEIDEATYATLIDLPHGREAIEIEEYAA